MAEVTAGQTRAGIGIETTEGTPVGATKLLELVSGGFDRNLMRLYSRSHRNRRTRRNKTVAGRSEYTGNPTVEVRAEGGFPRLLLATLPVTTTNLATPTRYRHRFRNAFGAKSATYIEDKSLSYHVFPGTRGDSLDLSFNKEEDSILLATFGLRALAELIYPLATEATAEADLDMDTAGADPLDPYSPVTGVATIGGASADVREFSASISGLLRPKNTFDGSRGASKHIEHPGDTSGRVVLYFSSMAMLEDYFGQSAPAGAFGSTLAIVQREFKIEFTPPNNAGGFANIITVCFPKADLERVGDPIPEDGELMQTVDIAPSYDSVSGTDFYIEITSSEANATLIGTGTNVTDPPETTDNSIWD